MILELSVGGVGQHLGLPARMFAPVTGTAPPGTVGPTTLLAARVASNAECIKKWIRLGALIFLTSLALEGLVAALGVAIDLVGNPGIGFALGITFSLLVYIIIFLSILVIINLMRMNNCITL